VKIPPLLIALRPSQWTKNLVVAAALVFVGKATDPSAVATTLGAIVVWCGLASGVYLVNDLCDRERDRQHPRKRHRPLASGRISPTEAVGAAVVLLLGSLGCATVFGRPFLALCALYVAVSLGYSLALREVVILDILAVSSGFVIRAAAGAAALHVETSSWILMCTLYLSLLLSLGKRRQELSMLEAGAARHRANLEEYSLPFLDGMMLLFTGAALMTYTLYAFTSGRHTTNLAWTLPCVLYGLLRYLYLVFEKGEGGSPTDLLLQDRPLQVTVLAWGLIAGAILHFQP
jgi:4-hydroxybenzoate polyprenyltransferase